jgi:2'-5' RNA ligase
VLDALDDVVARVGAPPVAGLRWVPRAQWHITLRFLGPVAAPDRFVAVLRHALAGLATGRIALGDSGAFPTPARATVLWVGVHEGAEWLRGPAGAVERAAVGAGLAPEPRPFRPHLTLARIRTPRPIQPLLREIGSDPIGPAWTVDDVVLFESDTRADGAVHHPIHSFHLGSSPLGSSPLGSSPLGSSPLGSSPLGSSPLGTPGDTGP